MSTMYNQEEHDFITEGPGVWDFMQSLFAKSNQKTSSRLVFRVQRKTNNSFRTVKVFMYVEGLTRDGETGRVFHVQFLADNGKMYDGNYDLRKRSGWIEKAFFDENIPAED